jgi:hypothetical protein
LKLYKLLLEVVEKHLTILKTIKDLRAASLDVKEDSDLESRANRFAEKAVADAIEITVTSVDAKVPDGRVNEIKIALGKDARSAIDAIANGTRVEYQEFPV